MQEQFDFIADVERRGEAQSPTAFSARPEWFCLRTHVAREHIAAAQLRQHPAIEVFLPRVRYQQALRRRRTWITEALFPNYIFARFDLVWQGRRVRGARAVKDVVHFGARFPTIPEDVIEELRTAIGPEELCVVDSLVEIGQLVRIAGGHSTIWRPLSRAPCRDNSVSSSCWNSSDGRQM
jgi:hypothetical protein